MNPIETLMETATPLQRKLLEGCKWIPETGCWEWVGKRRGKYGRQIGNTSVRVISFSEFIGPLFGNDKPEPSCGNPDCINPTHLVSREIRPNGYWNLSTLMKESKKFKTRAEFQQKSPSAYSIAQRMGVIDNICEHMGKPRQNLRKYTREDVIIAAKKYRTRNEFRRNDRRLWEAAHRNGWEDEAFAHMERTRMPPGFWQNKDNCANEAKKYSSISDFAKNADAAYRSAKKEGILEEICSHMRVLKMPSGHWDDKLNCLRAAKLFESRVDFHKNNGPAYQAALRNGWIDEFFPPLRESWTYDKCKQIADSCKGRYDFRRKKNGAYEAARKNGWLDDFFPKNGA